MRAQHFNHLHIIPFRYLVFFFGLATAMGAFPSFTQAQATPCPRYVTNMQQGKAAFAKKDYESALKYFLVAQIATRECGIPANEANKQLQAVFDAITRQSETLKESLAIAKRALAQNEELLRIFKREFDDFGLFPVEEEGVVVDTLGNKYPTAFSLNAIEATTQALYIEENGLKPTAQQVAKAPQLQLVVLGEYAIREPRNDYRALLNALEACKDLRVLALRYGNISTYPTHLTRRTGLEHLDFSSNPIDSLPETIGALTALQTLDLGLTRLTTLPESFGELTALQALNLRTTSLTMLPESFGKLTALQVLDLRNNRNLTTLPESFGGLAALQSLDLSGAVLNRLPESFGALSALQSLKGTSKNPIFLSGTFS